MKQQYHFDPETWRATLERTRSKVKALNLPVDKSSVYGFVFVHVMALAALFFFSWRSLWVALVLFWVTAGLGICLCYHRLLTHRSFECPKWIEYVLAVFGCLSSEGGPITWVGSHRYHHANSDQPTDIHSPRHGFWWSHVGWVLHDTGVVDGANMTRKYAPDLESDPFHRLLTRWNWVPQVVLGCTLLLWGTFVADPQGHHPLWNGVSLLMWGIFVRTVLGLHATWAVNSATHKWGYRTFKTPDDSRNLWWVALVAFGEGWHNNHHAFQHSARHGLRWWEFDMTFLTIRLMSILGLARNLRIPKLSKLPKLPRFVPAQSA